MSSQYTLNNVNKIVVFPQGRQIEVVSKKENEEFSGKKDIIEAKARLYQSEKPIPYTYFEGKVLYLDNLSIGETEVQAKKCDLRFEFSSDYRLISVSGRKIDSDIIFKFKRNKIVAI